MAGTLWENSLWLLDCQQFSKGVYKQHMPSCTCKDQIKPGLCLQGRNSPIAATVTDPSSMGVMESTCASCCGIGAGPAPALGRAGSAPWCPCEGQGQVSVQRSVPQDIALGWTSLGSLRAGAGGNHPACSIPPGWDCSREMCSWVRLAPWDKVTN